MNNKILISSAAFLSLLAAGASTASASEATVLYDAAGNAHVTYLSCNVGTARVYYTDNGTPIAAYENCGSSSSVIIIENTSKSIVGEVVTGTRATARRVARRTTNRIND